MTLHCVYSLSSPILVGTLSSVCQTEVTKKFQQLQFQYGIRNILKYSKVIYANCSFVHFYSITLSSFSNCLPFCIVVHQFASVSKGRTYHILYNCMCLLFLLKSSRLNSLCNCAVLPIQELKPARCYSGSPSNMFFLSGQDEIVHAQIAQNRLVKFISPYYGFKF